MILFLLLSVNTAHYLKIGKMYEQRGQTISAVRIYLKILPDTQAFSRIESLVKGQNTLKIYLAAAYFKIGKDKNGEKILREYLKSEGNKHIIGKNRCKADRADMEAIYILLSYNEVKIAGKIAEDATKKRGICGYRNVLWDIYARQDTGKALKFLLKDLGKDEPYSYIRILDNIPKKFRGFVKKEIKRHKYDFLYGVLINYYLDESQSDSALIFLDKIPDMGKRVSAIHKIMRYGIENKDDELILRILEKEQNIKWTGDEMPAIKRIKMEQKIKKLVVAGKIDAAIKLATGNGRYLSRLLVIKGDYSAAELYLKKAASNGDINALDCLILIKYNQGKEAEKLALSNLLDTAKIGMGTPFSSLLYGMENGQTTFSSQSGDSLTQPYFLYFRWKNLISAHKKKEAKKHLDTLLIKYPQSTPWFIINTLRQGVKQ